MGERTREEGWVEEELVLQWMPNRLFSRREFMKLVGEATITTATLALLAGCGQQPSASSAPTAGVQAAGQAQKAPRTLKLGYLVASATHHPGLAMAGEKGFFTEAGIQPKWGEYNAGAQLVQAITSGDIDAGVCGAYPALMGRAQGIDLRILAASNLEGSILVAAPNIKDVKELNGKKVATPGIAAIQDSLLLLLEEKHGIKCEHFYVKVTDMPTYLKNGEVAAYICWEPTGTAGLEKSGGRIMLTSKDIRPKHQCCVLIASNKLIQSEPETVLNMVKAYQQGVKYAVEHRDEFDQFTAKDAATTLAIAKDANSRAVYPVPSYNEASELKFAVESLVKFKKIQEGQITDQDKFLADVNLDTFIKKVNS